MSGDLNPDFIERYQLLLEKDPKSKLFAPLAEAYRKRGWLEEAHKLCEKGVDHNPYFPSGRVVFARVLLEEGKREEALQHLKAATELSPENILAQRLLAQTFLELRKPKEALKAFKMVLFLNPEDEVAIRNVRRLESLTADEFDDELFEMKPLVKAMRTVHTEVSPSGQVQTLTRGLERAISLIDAFVVRADFDRAFKFLEESENELGSHPELQKRRTFLTRRHEAPAPPESPAPLAPLPQDFRRPQQLKMDRLKVLLQRINDRRVE